LLACGHTFCEICLIKILNKNWGDLTCPTCQAKFKNIQCESDIKSLIKNYNLLRIVDKLESRKSIISRVSYNLTKPIHESHGHIETKEIDNTYNSFSQSKYLSCIKHNTLSHSYALGTNITLCDKCITETNLTSQPFQSIVKDLRSKIHSSITQIDLYKNEVNRLYDFFNSYQLEFENTNTKKIETLFDYLNKILLYNYNTAIQILDQCKSEQKIQIDNRLNELEHLKNELAEIKLELINYNNIDDEKELIKYIAKINSLNRKINFFLNYDLELSLLALKIGVKDDIQNKLFTTIQDSYYVDVEFTKINGEPPTLKHILQKDVFWACFCGEIVS